MAERNTPSPGLLDQNSRTKQPRQAVSAAAKGRLLRCAKRTGRDYLLKDGAQAGVTFRREWLNAALPVQIEKLGLRTQGAESRGSDAIGKQVRKQLRIKRNQRQIAEAISSRGDRCPRAGAFANKPSSSSLVQGVT